MIAVDWGTSNFRAFRLDAQGAVAARRSSERGMLAVPAGEFEAALRAEIAPWLADGETQVLLCGMVGSRQGWIEAPYLPCPAGLDELANAVVAVPFAGAQVRLVPGVSAMTGVPELMRGEETAAMGICDSDGVVCFPGTHSKWVQLSDRKVVSFTTAMTGEVFSALRKCTILGRMMTDNLPTDKAAFLAGVCRSADAGGLLHHLFGGVEKTGECQQLRFFGSPHNGGVGVRGHNQSASRGFHLLHLCGRREGARPNQHAAAKAFGQDSNAFEGSRGIERHLDDSHTRALQGGAD